MTTSSSVYNKLKSIRKKIESGKELRVSEVVFLEVHKEEIKEYFPYDPILWQKVDIPEFVGKFTELDVKRGRAIIEIEAKMRETGLKSIITEWSKDNILSVWLSKDDVL